MCKKLIKQILSHSVFEKEPPVLVDVGASGEIHENWKEIAPYSICLAFGGDDRDLKLARIRGKGYRELIVYHRILTSEPAAEAEFYLTKFPHCSSSLHPDYTSLSEFYFRDLFEVQKKVKLKAVTLQEVLQENNLKYVDWFKTDSQGTDLRLFCSMGATVISLVKIAEFEPGLIDAYQNEDKFLDLLCWMKNKTFYLDDLHIEQIYRVRKDVLQKLQNGNPAATAVKKVPGWVNALFINTGADYKKWSMRDCLFYLVCCILNKQYSAAYYFASAMQECFPEEKLFSEVAKSSSKKLKYSCLNLIRNRIKIRLRWMIEKYL